MQNATGNTYGFLSQIFQLYLMVIDKMLNNPDLAGELRYVLIIVYSLVFIILLFLLFSFAKLLLTLLARGASVFFAYLSAALDNPKSLPYVSVLVLLQSVPWYFSLLVLILIFCGLAALVTSDPVWSESFKYIMGATVGSLIGVVQKKEQVAVESRLYALLEHETAKSISEPAAKAVTPDERQP